MLTFRRNQRLIKENFKTVLDDGKRRVTPFFVYLALPNRLGKARLGMIITKKCLTLSTERNVVKRVIRESFRLHQAQLVGWDIVIISRYRIVSTSKDKLISSLERYWQELASC